jgi:hypothetical protein
LGIGRRISLAAPPARPPALDLPDVKNEAPAAPIAVAIDVINLYSGLNNIRIFLLPTEIYGTR